MVKKQSSHLQKLFLSRQLKMFTARLFVFFIFFVASHSTSNSANTWIAHPESLQYNLPIFPSKIPFGSSTFSTSTAVMISFARHQCLATATATGVCRRRSTGENTAEDESSILEKSNAGSTPPQLEPTSVLSEEMLAWPRTAVPIVVSSEVVSAISSSAPDSRFVQKLMTSTALFSR